jgi:hypothetical protein
VKGDADEEENSKPAIIFDKSSVVIIIKHDPIALLCIHFITFLPRTRYTRTSRLLTPELQPENL